MKRHFLVLSALVSVAACATRSESQQIVGHTPVQDATQLIVVTTAGWDSITGELRRFVRADPTSAWRREGDVVAVVVGRTGVAWGVGFDSFAGPHKREGDGRSPAGVFPLGDAFGFASADSMHWLRLPYLPLTPAIDCVDDPASVHYNSIVNRETVHVDWKSAERMRQIEAYRLGFVVGYNSTPAIKARGSRIFFHIWTGPRAPTAGCSALAETELTRLLAWLDPRARPRVVQLPRTAYRERAREWGLPPLEP